MRLSVLIVDDEHTFRQRAAEALVSEGFDVRAVGTLARARAEVSQSIPDAIILDRRLPDGDGIDFLSEVQAMHSGVAVMVVTAHGELANALPAGNAGHVTKPLHPTDLVIKLQKLLETRHLRESLPPAHPPEIELPRVQPKSAGKRAAFDRLHHVAPSLLTPVLMTGPSGVGKQFAAETLHRLTFPDQPDAPFVEVNCAALPADTCEGDLFGQEAGASHDVNRDRRGLLEIAHGGTLFLDEVTGMPPRLQSKLLRFLDNMRFRRQGSQREMSVHLRVIAATNQDIVGMVREGKFREDLYHRLAVFLVAVPPLSSGREDIEPLAHAFVQYFAARIKKPIRGVNTAAMRALQSYDYPGNVRELRNLIERAVILARGQEISAHDVVLPEPAWSRSGRDAFFSVDLDKELAPLPLEHIERQYVARVLVHCKGHRTAAAEALGISYPTFLKRLRELGLGDDHAQSQPS